MPLPEKHSDFDRLLGSLRSSPREERDDRPWRSVVVVDPGQRGRGDEVRLWFAEEGELEFDTMVERVVQELAAIGHVATERMAWIVLALASGHEGGLAAAALNARLAQTTSCEASLWQIFPVGMGKIEVRLPRFRIGSLDWPRLAATCASARSDWSRIHERAVVGRLAIERAPTQTRWLSVADPPDPAAVVRTRTLRAAYAEEVASGLFEKAWQELADDQELLLAAGAPPLDEHVLRSVGDFRQLAGLHPARPDEHHFVEVAAATAPRSITFIARQLGRAQKEVEEWLGHELAGTRLDPVLDLFVRYLAKARRHAHEGKPDDAFLSYVIALELLLGRGVATTDAVARRVGAITGAGSRESFDARVRLVRGLYDARSRYVHDGRSVDNRGLQDIGTLSREVLASAIRARARHATAGDFAEWWRSQLDFLAAAVVAGETLPPDKWHAAGIVPGGRPQ